MKLTVGQREFILELLYAQYIIPEQYKEVVTEAIKQYKTRHLTDEAIHNMVNRPQSLAADISSIRKKSDNGNIMDFSQFRGLITEWLVCMEYNLYKNKGAVIMTIVNPDTTSKADLLHIVEYNEGYKVFPGPDCKTGNPEYVLSQWEKIVFNRYDIPMVDADGILTTEEGLTKLTKAQRRRFNNLLMLYPRKKPIPSIWKQNITPIMRDYIKFLRNGATPSRPSAKMSTFTHEDRDETKRLLTEEHNLPLKNWEDFSNISKAFTKIDNNYKSNLVLRKESKVRTKASQHIPDEMFRNILKTVFKNDYLDKHIIENNHSGQNITNDMFVHLPKIMNYGNGENTPDSSSNYSPSESAMSFTLGLFDLSKGMDYYEGYKQHESSMHISFKNREKVSAEPVSNDMESALSEGSKKCTHYRREHDRRLRDGRFTHVKGTIVNKGK